MEPIPNDRRYISVKLLGFPVLLHWTFPATGFGIGFAVAILFVTTSVALSAQVFFWTTAAVILLVLAHEFGHAMAARRLSLDLVAIVIAHVGGRCFVATQPSPREDLLFSAAGLLVQTGILLMTLVWLWLLGPPTSLPMKCVVIVFTGGNILLMAINLVPHQGNDGARIISALRALWLAPRT